MIEDKTIVDSLIKDIIKPNLPKIKEAYEKVNKLGKINRVKNSATNDIEIKENGSKMNIDCYIQEYENVPGLFTVEIEKFINEYLQETISFLCYYIVGEWW